MTAVIILSFIGSLSILVGLWNLFDYFRGKHDEPKFMITGVLCIIVGIVLFVPDVQTFVQQSLFEKSIFKVKE